MTRDLRHVAEVGTCAYCLCPGGGTLRMVPPFRACGPGPLTSPDTRAGATPETMKEGAAVHPGARPLPSPTNDRRSLLCRCRKGEIKAKQGREGGVTLIQRSAGVAGHRLLVCGRGQCSQLPRYAASRTRAVGSGFANFLDCAESQDHCRRSCSRHSSRCVSMLEMARAGWAPC